MAAKLWFLQKYYHNSLKTGIQKWNPLFFVDAVPAKAPEPSKTEKSTEPPKTIQQEQHQLNDGNEDAKWVNSIKKFEAFFLTSWLNICVPYFSSLKVSPVL